MKVKNINEDNHGFYRVTILIWLTTVLWCIAGCIPDKDLIVTLNIPSIPDNYVRSIAWNDNGTQLAVVHGKQVNIWNTETWTQILSMGDGSAGIHGVAWRSDSSELATTDSQKYLTIWDAASGDAKARIKIHNYFPGDLFWPANRDEILAFYASRDRISVEIIRVSSSALSRSLLEVEEPNSYADDLCWLRIADAESVSVIRILDYNFDDSIFEALQGTCSPNGLYFAAYNTDQYQLNIWNIQTSQQIASIPKVYFFSGLLLWSPDGSKLISGGFSDTRFFVWDALHPAQLNYIAMPDDTFTYISGPRDFSWSPDGDKVALVAGPSGFEDTTPRILVLIWDINQMQWTQTIRMDGVGGFAWHPDGLQIAVAGGGAGGEGVKVWHVR